MSRQPTFSNLIHLRDFVDSIADDPSKDTPNYTEIHTDINVFEEDGFHSSSITVEPIRTRIHTYLTRQERECYVPNTFFYTDGRFSAAPSDDGTLEINIQTLSLMRHPGDVTDFDQYRQHLPGQWCPIVSVIGSVSSCDTISTDGYEPRSFVIETSVYDTSKLAPVHHSVACFLENTKRWEKVKTPQSGSFLSITAKVAGRTTDTNHLALRVLDLAYLPRSNSAAATTTAMTSTPATTPSSKRSRWERPAPSSTPMKKPRFSEPVGRITTPSKTTIQEPAHTALDDTMKSPSVPLSPSTIANYEESSVDSNTPTTSESATRPHRSRHVPRKYLELD